MAPTSQPAKGSLSFGKCYAVLNLDWMSLLIDDIKDTAVGQEFITSCCRWNDAVHKKDPRPLTIFTSLFFSNPSQLELAKDAPLTRLLQGYGTFEMDSPEVQIDSHFAVDEKDIVLQKTRWYAGAGNSLEQILRAQNIDTVIISGLSLSGVVMSTVYRLFDLDYNIYVISDNVVDLPLDRSKVLLDVVLPKMNQKAISIDDALRALERS